MSVLLIVGVLPFFMLIGLWAFYLSLVIAGQDFLSFQWDTLLLEAGFAALFVAPLQLWLRSRGTCANLLTSGCGYCAGWRSGSCFCRG